MLKALNWNKSLWGRAFSGKSSSHIDLQPGHSNAGYSVSVYDLGRARAANFRKHGS